MTCTSWKPGTRCWPGDLLPCIRCIQEGRDMLCQLHLLHVHTAVHCVCCELCLQCTVCLVHYVCSSVYVLCNVHCIYTALYWTALYWTALHCAALSEILALILSSISGKSCTILERNFQYYSYWSFGSHFLPPGKKVQKKVFLALILFAVLIFYCDKKAPPKKHYKVSLL